MIPSNRIEILVATRNPGKIREIQRALNFDSVRLRYLDEFPGVLEVEEVGQTYEENAALKAFRYSEATGVFALADDSGLEVDALGGAPGIFSARFGGADVSDAERINQLLSQLSEHPNDKRTARFICCMALVGWERKNKTGPVNKPALLRLSKGVCEGVIADEPAGNNGFGFDPVFVPGGYDATFAELPDEVKARISHRALALNYIKQFLEGFLS
jgi:XTP/dITP diphosphohydrolase